MKISVAFANLIGIEVTCENFSGKLEFVAVFDP